MKHRKDNRGRGILWRVLLAVFGVIMIGVLEFGRHTVIGWVLMVLAVLGFAWLRANKLPNTGRLKRFGAWCALLAVSACILWISWPPVRLRPAVQGRNGGITGTVHVEQGDLTGVLTEDGAVEVYAGIPYAEPPVGDLRWKEPVRKKNWEGILAADHFAPMSMQTRNLPIIDSLMQVIGYHDYAISLHDNFRDAVSEDSLYLNIWKPAGNVSDAPVLVYIHGGSLQTGQPWYADYSGENLAREGVIVVNMGYRLGIFGFYADEELAAESPNGTTGNYGLLDQLMALEWVHNNIAAFGGDPDNVTVSGESAGSACVSALTVSPLSGGLFNRVVGESSTVTAPKPAHSFRTLDEALGAAKATRTRLGAGSVAELRALPAEKIVSELSFHHHITVDGYVLTEMPADAYRKGACTAEAILHGYNREEAAPFILFDQASLKNYEEKVRRAFPGVYAGRVLELYPAATDAEAKRNWADINTVLLFTYGHYCWQRQAEEHGIPVYQYHFVKTNGRLGAWHSGEEVYLYGNIPPDSGLYDAKDRELSEGMKQYFLNFIRTGNPNGGGLPEWPDGDGSSRVMEFGDEMTVREAPYLELYAVLDEMYGWQGSGMHGRPDA